MKPTITIDEVLKAKPCFPFSEWRYLLELTGGRTEIWLSDIGKLDLDAADIWWLIRNLALVPVEHLTAIQRVAGCSYSPENQGNMEPVIRKALMDAIELHLPFMSKVHLPPNRGTLTQQAEILVCAADVALAQADDGIRPRANRADAAKCMARADELRQTLAKWATARERLRKDRRTTPWKMDRQEYLTLQEDGK